MIVAVAVVFEFIKLIETFKMRISKLSVMSLYHQKCIATVVTFIYVSIIDFDFFGIVFYGLSELTFS